MSETHVFLTTSVGSSGTLGALFQPTEAMVRTDCSQAPRAAIGLFRMPLAAEEHAELVRLVRGLPAESGPPASHLPGTPMLTIGLTEGGQTTQGRSAPANDVPPELQAVVSAATALIDRTLDYPEHALAAQAAWSDARVAAGGDLGLTLILRNVGSQPVLIANPAAGRRTVDVGVQIVLLRKDSVENLVLEPGEVRQEAAAQVLTAPEPALTLGAGEEARFLLRKTARLAPGRYRARLMIICRDPADAGRPGLAGQINLELPELELVKK